MGTRAPQQPAQTPAKQRVRSTDVTRTTWPLGQRPWSTSCWRFRETDHSSQLVPRKQQTNKPPSQHFRSNHKNIPSRFIRKLDFRPSRWHLSSINFSPISSPSKQQHRVTRLAPVSVTDVIRTLRLVWKMVSKHWTTNHLRRWRILNFSFCKTMSWQKFLAMFSATYRVWSTSISHRI